MDTENKYQRGKIYKLISNRTNLIYYGSTIEDKLTNRLSGHRRDYRRWQNSKFAYVSSFEIVKFEDVKIILVESYPCNTRYELLAREQWYIDNNDCSNKRKSYVGVDKTEYRKQYYQENKDIIDEKHKNYYKENKNELYEKSKKYYQSNKETIDEKRNKICICECGKTYVHHHGSDHLKTKRHRVFFETQKED